jgi:hypothetical protein
MTKPERELIYARECLKKAHERIAALENLREFAPERRGLVGINEALGVALERERQRIAELEAEQDKANENHELAELHLSQSHERERVLREALEGLCDYCGPPPVLYEEQWKEAMRKANAALAADREKTQP